MIRAYGENWHLEIDEAAKQGKVVFTDGTVEWFHHEDIQTLLMQCTFFARQESHRKPVSIPLKNGEVGSQRIGFTLGFREHD